MDIPSCHIPPIALGLITEDGVLMPFENVVGVQMLALIAAKAANDEINNHNEERAKK